jgi:hypothetical protein
LNQDLSEKEQRKNSEKLQQKANNMKNELPTFLTRQFGQKIIVKITL